MTDITNAARRMLLRVCSKGYNRLTEGHSFRMNFWAWLVGPYYVPGRAGGGYSDERDLLTFCGGESLLAGGEGMYVEELMGEVLAHGEIMGSNVGAWRRRTDFRLVPGLITDY